MVDLKMEKIDCKLEDYQFGGSLGEGKREAELPREQSAFEDCN
jgi:hypothetical protein